MMYNADFKSLFISDNEYKDEHLRSNYNLLFKLTAQKEKELNKDISNFTVSEIIDFYKTVIFTSSYSYLVVIHNRLKNYAQYSLEHNMITDHQNHFNEIDNDIIYACINIGEAQRKYITREALIKILNRMPNPSDQFLCLALFEGIGGAKLIDLSDLYPDSIKDNEITLLSGRTLLISDELVEYAMKSKDEYEYYPPTIASGCKRDKFYYDPVDRRIIKRMTNSKNDTFTVSSLITRLKRLRYYFDDYHIDPTSLKESGRFDYIMNLYNQGNYESIRKCIEENIDIIEYRYGTIRNNLNAYMRKIGAYLDEKMKQDN